MNRGWQMLDARLRALKLRARSALGSEKLKSSSLRHTKMSCDRSRVRQVRIPLDLDLLARTLSRTVRIWQMAS